MHGSRVVLLVGMVWLSIGGALAAPRDNGRPTVTREVQREAVKVVEGVALRRMVDEPKQAVKLDPTFLNPDLQVYCITWEPETYLPPAKLQVNIFIKNDGVTNAPPFHLSCWGANGAPGHVVYVDGLEEGVGKVFSFKFNYPAGPTPIHARVDLYNEIAETDEENNEATSTPTLAAGAYGFQACDLWVNSVSPGGKSEPTTQPVDGYPVEVCATVMFTNKVDGKSLSVPVNLLVDGQVKQTFNLEIAPNSMSGITGAMVLPGGDHTLQVAPAVSGIDSTPADDSFSRTMHWRTRAHWPYRFEYFALQHYSAIGSSSKDLMHVIDEAWRFANTMAWYGHSLIYKAEDCECKWDDWANGTGARVNQCDLAYYNGHGNQQGPAYENCGYDSKGDYKVEPTQYKFGQDGTGQQNLRWVFWQACLTMSDNGTDLHNMNWTTGDWPLSRWFGAFNGVHTITGMRSLGSVGEWWDWWYKYDTRERSGILVDQLMGGATPNWAWYLAQRWTVWDGLGVGFESATLSVVAENVDYQDETVTAPYPDYLPGTVTGYRYNTVRVATPKW